MTSTLLVPAQLPLLLPSRSALSMASPEPKKSRQATKRHQAGQERLSSLVSYWLRRSGLSLRQFGAIVDWGLGEGGWLPSGQVSHLSRGNIQKVSIRYLDALAAANHAIWLWKTHGRERAIADLGPFQVWGVEAHWLDDAEWLPAPEQPELELDLGDLAQVVAGRLELPYLAGPQLTPNEGQLMVRELGWLLDQLVQGLGLSPRASMDALLAAYPGDDPKRRELLRDLLLGDAELSTAELQEELAGLAEMVRVIRKLPVGEYGPAELRAELVADRRRY